jgi:outer membrane immunogenic protein
MDGARETLTLAGAPVPFALDHHHRNGYTVGARQEMFAPNWSAKAEYHYNFGDSRFIAPAFLAQFGSFHNDGHKLKAGVNYRFNFGGPIVARY